jgi:hypothetical protein
MMTDSLTAASSSSEWIKGLCHVADGDSSNAWKQEGGIGW